MIFSSPRFCVPDVSDEFTREAVLRFHEGMHASFSPDTNTIRVCWLPEVFDGSIRDVDWFVYVLNHEYLHWAVYHATGSVEACMRLDNVDDGTFSITDEGYDFAAMTEGALECPECGGNYVPLVLDVDGEPVGEECIECDYSDMEKEGSRRG